MIEIDCSTGEGGGQIIRTAVAVASIMDKPVHLYNIRENRTNPGLRAQHLKGLEALATLCNGKINGGAIGSKEVDFIPGEIQGQDLNINVGTAGSISLVLQTLMLPAIHCKNSVTLRITGGTDVKWSPQIDYMKYVLLPLLRKMNYQGNIELEKRGYYPKGGGIVTVNINPCELKALNLTQAGNVTAIRGISHASSLLKKSKVAERQANKARGLIFEKHGLKTDISTAYGNSTSIGSGIVLWAETEHSVIGASALGERGNPAEDVGEDAVLQLTRELTGAVDRHAADQLVPYIAIAGGKIKTSRVTEHCKTNVWVCNQFGLNVEITNNEIKADGFKK